ncbi:hypothetical protein BDFB_010283 [Asbolus verrucosus]|uniref:Uncharacterized protein n=1 Tax=Asbolus verrucosus TaxID=1661398 RepID=A0A482VQF9_ASBVE|nr:hypothetical protein BDFB_010283 [Asbolus verrucosus]
MESSEERTQSYSKQYAKLNNNEINEKLTTQIFIQNDQKYLSSKYVALVKKKQVRKPLLSTVDIIVCLVVLSPCVVGSWRGIWQLMDINCKHFPGWPSFLLGGFIHLVFILIQDTLNDVIKKKSSNIWKKMFNLIVARIYIYIFTVACNMHWRGGWMLIDEYFGIQTSPSGTVLKKGSGFFVTIFGGCFFLTIALRSLCNCIAPPFIFCLDRKDTLFTIPTRFNAKVRLFL